ncbi:MAG: N-acetylmuramoyl-L-alanine amidase [Candidatus Brocadiaceae bacterium]|nr:N-acetylmuramoyl-L-alanine amidase [Candidatus Brocadiaceae bacterium]
MRHLQLIAVCTVLALLCGCVTAGSKGRPAPASLDDASEWVPVEEPAPVAVPEPPARRLATDAAALAYELGSVLRRPPLLQGRLDVPLRRDWRYIVIHHSATDSGNRAIFDHHHRTQRKWQGVGYDFVIGNGSGSADGKVEVTFRWESQITGAHAASAGNEYNQYGIGICLVGNLQHDHPTARQMEALVGLVNYLQTRCGIPTCNVLGHRHVPDASTECPGRNFPWYEFLSRLDH